MQSPAELRKRIRAARRTVDPPTRADNNTKICQSFLDLDWFKSAQNIAAYLAFDGEADPMELMTAAIDQGKEVYLPIIVGKSKPLAFAPWTPSTKMVKNRFDILEPKVEQAKLIAAEELDLVVCPLVAFDDNRNRIGVGGGFYDRTFAFLNEPGHDREVRLVGFAFELQKLDSIEQQTWDVRLDAVVTESRIYR